MKTISLLIALLILSVVPVRAQSTSAELLFTMRSAAKTHSIYGLGQCFNFEGVDNNFTQSMRQVIEQISTWSDPYLFTTERKGAGPLEITQNGQVYKLNGDWSFQVHVHNGPPPSKGFVFPAGLTPSGRCLILLNVKKEKS